MPNEFAYFTLLVWPIVSIVLYKKYPVITATFWTIIGGYLLLPVGVDFDFPLIPPLDKKSIPAIMAFIGCRYIAKRKVTFLPPSGIERKLIILLFLGSVATVITNGEAVVELNRNISGLRFHDTLSTVIFQWLMLIPFILGIQIIKSHQDQIQLLRLLVVVGLCYSLLIIFEIRMSPQLHTWVYGFFPHSWAQQLRYGGFRPVVFLGHGLWVSVFIVTVLGAMVSLSKEKIKYFQLSNRTFTVYLLMILIFSKGVGSIILGFSLISMMIFLKIEFNEKASRMISSIALFYPVLCIFNLFPHQQLVSIIDSFDTLRARSLEFRFDHEALLLDRAKEKLIFGWGGWGRNRLENSVSDGYWIIILGKYGLIGFASIFGLIFSAVYRTHKSLIILTSEKERFVLVGSSILISTIMIDQIPNASISPLFWLLVGGLTGRHCYIHRHKTTPTANR